MEKIIRDAAFNTQVTLSVGQLMESSPGVRSEVLGSRPLRGEAANFAANEAGLRRSSHANDAAYKADTGHAEPLAFPNAPVTSIARMAAKINHVPQTCIVDTGCSGVVMGLRSVRACQMIHNIDREAGKERRFRIANGKVETPLGVIHSVPITVGPVTTFADVTVCNADTDFILLGIKFLCQLDVQITFNPPGLSFLSDDLQRVTVPLDFTGEGQLHEISYMAEDCSMGIPPQGPDNVVMNRPQGAQGAIRQPATSYLSAPPGLSRSRTQPRRSVIAACRDTKKRYESRAAKQRRFASHANAPPAGYDGDNRRDSETTTSLTGSTQSSTGSA